MEKPKTHIAVLDGIRAYAMLIIMGFHFWQQSWLQGVIPYDCLSFLGIQDASLTWIPRTGYMWVDILLLLSAFCLFLPYAGQMTDPLAPAPDSPCQFYVKRATRILPPYYLCLLLSLLFFVRPADYSSTADFWKDLITHLTFTHTFFPETYFSTKYSTVLWTLGIEVQFYLVFPFLTKLFRRFPFACWMILQILAQGYISLFAHTADGGADSFHINQFPAHLGVFANGMLAAYLCCLLRRRMPHTKKMIRWGGTLLSAVFAGVLIYLLRNGLNRAEVIQRWQVDYLFLFSVCTAAFILALDHAHKGVQWLFSNRAARFIAAISYNLYLYHATIMLQLKAHRIPFYPEPLPDAYAWPQSASGASWYGSWQLGYTVIFWITSIAFAALVTFLFERPVGRCLLRKSPNKYK